MTDLSVDTSYAVASMELLPDDWSGVFASDTPLLELVARGSALYFGVLVFARVMPRRTGGELAMMDLIFVLLIAEAAAHTLSDYSSVVDGMIVIATGVRHRRGTDELSSAGRRCPERGEIRVRRREGKYHRRKER